MTELSITPVNGSLNIGDRVTAPPLPDRRSWWQRTAPRLLGGKDEPKPLDAVIVATATGGR